MAVRIRKGWLIAGLALTLSAVIGWAWWDGGTQPLREMSAPTNLPEQVQ